MGVKERVAHELEDARERTLTILNPIADADLERQVSPLMSPLAWDLAHVAHYEELWLLRELTAAAPTDDRFDDLYDAFKHPRRERAGLPILDAHGAREFAEKVRARTLEVLDVIDLRDDDPLTRDAFVYGMVIQHEHQHRETMLATIQLMGSPVSSAPAFSARSDVHDTSKRAENGDGDRDHAGKVSWPGGTFVMGTSTEPWALDNERPAHEVEVAPFVIDAAPVTNAQYLEFLDDGGYADERLWTEAGWAWRREAALEHPEFWSRAGGRSWSVLRFGHEVAVAPDEPVQHVCWYEADAFARWAGARLPTEAEWELAAGVLLHGAGAGGEQSVGDVWEWTSTDFLGYPGFVAHPYPEYSKVFFGDEYKVLRGGSWATHPTACRTTFRNWDYPIRRQIFCGFRCASDA